MKKNLLFLSIIFLILSCKTEVLEEVQPSGKRFTSLPAAYTGVDFENKLEYTATYNPYIFKNFYNGGGVGIGDINNDGLPDLFFSGNLVDNKLYLNKGDFRFEDITKRAGVAVKGVWTSGVSFADVNGDGWLDIYLCKSGEPGGKNRHNELFINNGASLSPEELEKGPTFTEKAEAYGIADLGLSTHAAFLDYDRDGDLDLYLLNNSIRSVGGYDLRKNQREIRDPEGGNKLYRNDGDHFTDVSEAAGIYGSNIGFGLGVTISDINLDGWPDIYVSNDFFERDYLYINQQDGTFKEDLESQIREISLGSMGADIGDINNDGLPDIFVTDMLPEDDARIKTKTAFENWDKYQLNVRNGYHQQFTRNVLQLNNGNNTFSEIGRLAGVSATDWSWGALMMDMDNDGWNDIFVANGIYQDLTDQDYINFYADPAVVRSLMEQGQDAILKMIDAIPSQALSNYAFKNEGNLGFHKAAEEWGLDERSFSNGSAYGDLDNDGDLDLVTNNINMPPFIYRNETVEMAGEGHNYLVFQLSGRDKNPFAIGTKIILKHQGQTFYRELNPMRGFQSTVDYRVHIGLGDIKKVDSVFVEWPWGQSTLLTDVDVNQHILIDGEQSAMAEMPFKGSDPVEEPVFKPVDSSMLPYRHQENNFVDFDRDQLIYHMLSNEGPKIATGDINGDGREDVYIGGAKESSGALWIQQAGGRFSRQAAELFEVDQTSEDIGCTFFDADGDRDLDLYVASGGYEFSGTSSALKDRLYVNDGRGNFSKSPQFLPTTRYVSTSCVRDADIDGDGDLDLFAGSRLRPFLYGVPSDGFILQNDGRGTFTDVTKKVAPGLEGCGMITDALWMDYDKDNDPDLFVVGEWMEIKVFRNDGGKFIEAGADAGFKASSGFWNCIRSADLNGDGYEDLVLGNHGKNTRLKATPDKPMNMYINDFDRNGSIEQIVCVYNGEASYPLVLRHDLIKQLPHLKKKYLKYAAYQEQQITDIFTEQERDGMLVLEAKVTESMIAMNQGDGTFVLQSLPLEAQFAPVYAILLEDFNNDGSIDILLGGNFSKAKPEIGIYEAGYGLFLQNDGTGAFISRTAKESGFSVKGEIRDLTTLSVGGKQYVLVARNNDEVKMFAYQ